jgi:hypothetical protein
MKSNYLIVLFKNKKKRKIIKHYANKNTALDKFKELVNDNNKVLFEKQIENATPCDYEIALLTNQTKIQESLFLTDDLGRNNPVNLENPDYVFLQIKKYKIEETIFDWQNQKKIKFSDLIKTYCSDKNLKSIFTLNNKLCIQIDEDVSMFSLKDKEESERLLEIMQDYFISNSRLDAFFVKDVSNAQRKWLYDIMEKKGFDKRRLYRLKTTFSKR